MLEKNFIQMENAMEFAEKKKEKENETNELNNKSRFTLEEYFLTVAGENRSFPLPFQHLSRYRCNATNAMFFDVQRARAV